MILQFTKQFNKNLLFEKGGQQSNDLLKVALDIITNTQCSQMYGQTKKLRSGIVNSQICAGYLAGGKDTCQVILIFCA